MGEDFPAVGFPVFRNPLGVDRDDYALVAELVGGLRDEIRILHRCGIDRDLVGTAEKQLADVSDGADTAADGERHEAMVGGARYDVENRVAIVGRSGDVEKAEFVRSRRIIGLRRLDGITGVDQVDEVHALDDAAVFHIEAWDNAGFEGHTSTPFAALMRASASEGSMRPS